MIRSKSLSALGASVVVCGAMLVAGPAFSASAAPDSSSGSATTTTTSSAPATSTATSTSGSQGQWYVAMGDSLAAGYQPAHGSTPAGDHKTGGYAGSVLAALQKADPNVQLENLGCSGETTSTMTDGSICTYPEGSQLAAGAAFLKAHEDDIALVTIDLGSNDVEHCVTGGTIDKTCVEKGLKNVGANLPTILAAIRKDAPQARIVVANYYNPFLAVWLSGPDGQKTAHESAELQTTLNKEIAGAAAAVKASVADVAAAFDSDDFTDMTTLPKVGQVPMNVARICEWTWMCTQQNIHPNDAGYAKIAGAIVAAAARVPAQTGSTTTATPTTTVTTPVSTTATTSSETAAAVSSSTSTAPPALASTGTTTFWSLAVALLLLLSGSALLAVARQRRSAQGVASHL